MYKMVIVDDESMALEQLRDFFVWDLLGLEISDTFDSSIDALNFIQKNRIDILLTDISMPNLNGIELAKECQKKYPNLKIIFFSGYRDFDYLKQAMELKAVEYLTKPINYDDFLATVKKVVAQLNTEHQRIINLKQQQILSSLLCGMISDTETLESYLNEIGIPREYVYTPCALINIKIDTEDNFPTLLNLYDRIIQFINQTTEQAFFMHIRYIMSDFEIMCILKKPDSDIDSVISAYIKRLCSDTMSEINLDTQLLSVAKFDSINDLVGISIDTEQEFSNGLIEKALEYVKSNYAKPITSEEVAGFIGFSPSYFRLYFKKNLGKNFNDYLTEIRMQKACDMLINSDYSISYICENIGYANRTHFYKRFQAIYDISPNEYRNKYKLKVQSQPKKV